MKKINKLTTEEEEVIIHKHTEAPFSGKYNDFFSQGYYTCKRCNLVLYRSKDKFRSNCGWPSFDDSVQGAIKEVLDSDGNRVEILCSNCNAHLGHVFIGERLTTKNKRYCVNSISMNFVLRDEIKLEKAIFAGGCFWGVQYYLKQLPGVIETTVGYTGGTKENPSYEDVLTHKTGHVETVEVLFDPIKTNYEEVAKRFFEIHDPTQNDGQGPDIGNEYLSVIFYVDDNQKMIAQKLINQLIEKGYKISTTLRKANKFYIAENYHQEYYEKNKSAPYCHKYTKRF